MIKKKASKNGFKSLGALKSALEDVILDAMTSDIANQAMDIIIDSANSEIYEPVSPHKYERRYSFINDNNYIIDIVQPLGISITPDVEFSQYPISNNTGNELAGLIEFGDGWNGYYYEYTRKKEESEYKHPRRFLEKSFDTITENNAVVTSLIGALEFRGLKVK